MLAHCFAAALRHLARSRFYAAISVAGLAVGISALMLMLLVVRAELGYNGFVRDADRVYVAVSTLEPKQHPADYQLHVSHTLAPALKLHFPQIASIARITTQPAVLAHGEVSARETIYWADPAFFEVMPLPVIAGDLDGALRRPDGIVLPRSVARKFFGRDDPLGATLQLNQTLTMTVTAIIEDLPTAATDLESGIFASGINAASPLTLLDKKPANPAVISVDTTTYLRLAPLESIDTIRAGMAPVVEAQWPQRPPGLDYEICAVRRRDSGRAPAGRAPAGRAPAGRAPAGRAPAGRAPAGRAHRRPAQPLRRSREAGGRPSLRIARTQTGRPAAEKLTMAE